MMVHLRQLEKPIPAPGTVSADSATAEGVFSPDGCRPGRLYPGHVLRRVDRERIGMHCFASCRTLELRG